MSKMTKKPPVVPVVRVHITRVKAVEKFAAERKFWEAIVGRVMKEQGRAA